MTGNFNSVTGGIDLQPHLGNLEFTRDGVPFSMNSGWVTLVFQDIHNLGEIEKILMDPLYRSGKNPDFVILTRIVSPASGHVIEGFSTCYWEGSAAKDTAICGVDEMDGGYFKILVQNRGPDLRSSSFLFVIASINGFSGFHLGFDEPVGGEMDRARIDVKLKGSTYISVAVTFDMASGHATDFSHS